MRSIATLTRTLTVSQDTNNGSEVEAVVTSNRGGLGPVTHSFPPSHQGGRGTTIERQPLPCQQPTKEVYLTPLCMNNSGTNRSPNSVSPHSGVHPTCLTIQRSYSTTFKSPRRGDGTPTPSHQGVDGAVARRPRSTGRHVRVTKDSTNLPAREYDVTMSFHGSRSKRSTGNATIPSLNDLGTLAGPRSLLLARYRGPHPPTHQ